MNQNTSSSRFTLRSIPGEFFELLGSMRFAVSLLMFICVASTIGTVLEQNRASSQYIDQFGPFWFELFDKFSIWHIYNSWWFLLIMTFLVASTSVCLIRNAPKMLRDAVSFRDYVRASSLRAFPQRTAFDSAASVPAATDAVRKLLKHLGYAVRERQDNGAVLLAAKKGSANRLGYILAHTAMIVICIGGLLDSELPIRLQVWLGGKHPIFDNMLISQVPDSGRLSLHNPSFRSSMLVPEGGRANSAVVMVNDGALVQPIPFTLTLKKFAIDYYSTGMPSRFASEVEVQDPDTGKTFDQTIEVNEPLRYKGVTVYQSSFDDGGSTVQLRGYPLRGTDATPFLLDGTVGKTSDAGKDAPPSLHDVRVDVTALRPINVEDLSGGTPKPATNFSQDVAAVAGSAAGKKNDNLRNVGPAVEFRLVDASGQSHEFRNYMLPVVLDGAPVFLTGVRSNASEPYRYARLPVDADNSVAEFMRLRALLADPQARKEAAQRFADKNAPQGVDKQPLEAAAERALQTFSEGGLQAVAAFLQSNTQPADMERAADIVVRLIGSSVAELRAIERERAGLPPLATSGEAGAQAAVWSRIAVAALSDLALYPSPVFFTLADFKQVQASVFQVSRTPGKKAVYLGCLLLILGVFSMFYIRDRRVWVWITPEGDSGSAVQAAMTSQRRTLDFQREFERFKQALLRLKQ
ncbi:MULTISPECIES: cytochrome c biogenesis protein ResB [unclassified Achromobacter]|uniref:cytochrome c biogenesis protein ResB n=1 Tax=unclassified Achromobacter TaxID=2626865 RepID=UPI000B51B363|nr:MULTISPECIES: cytochrome c biogenesis protein ResB [unclassified Achromobacter]OWT75031.1 cytochrome C biogenesis protein ResB [Achromobacter sp. HZ28]OWT76640.1 cytochrome C biogenesis protein ResB [Achromobacter sp. HZ34]